MLFFILLKDTGNLQFAEFKYISCYSLSLGPGRYDIYQNPFKYISCYSLSGTPGIEPGPCDLNTSHVILYQFSALCKSNPDYI